SRIVGRRMFAVPLPDEPAWNVAEGEGRRALVAAAFGACTPPPGMTREQFLDAAAGIVEQLWQDEGDTFAAAERMFVEGGDAHEIHPGRAVPPAPTMGSAIIR